MAAKKLPPWIQKKVAEKAAKGKDASKKDDMPMKGKSMPNKKTCK